MIDKVITSLQDVESMQEINLITGLEFDSTDNWVDLSAFDENPELKKYVKDYEFDALQNGEADYIAFRFDD
ncbi:hypothetical protein IJ384_02920 [bacterium]|nr:hypothetical protein [bacterium]